MKIITSALIASQYFSPLNFYQYNQEIYSQFIAEWVGEVKRVYCSSKSIGFDLHFNSQSGQIYSFNEFLNRLEPFNIESEIPFLNIFRDDIITDGSINVFLDYWIDLIENQIIIDTYVNNGNLFLKVSDIYLQDYILASLNLYTLKMQLDLSNQYSIEDQILVDGIVSEIKCEYIEPESYYL